jgi:large subunit ribosomal protein L21
VRIFKMRRRKHYQKHQGHRQNYTELLISQIASDLGVFKAEAKAPAKAPGKAAAAKSGAGDDLTRIEGIGPKIAVLLQEGGIASFADLAAAPADRLKELLEAAGSTFATHDPTTWPEQAGLAAKGDWDALEKLKAELDGGKRT